MQYCVNFLGFHLMEPHLLRYKLYFKVSAAPEGLAKGACPDMGCRRLPGLRSPQAEGPS